MKADPPQFNGFEHRKEMPLGDISASWCPNCHDEAFFLEVLHRQYHDQGVEFVAPGFEEEDQLNDHSRLRAFILRNGIDYTYLIAGEPTYRGHGSGKKSAPVIPPIIPLFLSAAPSKAHAN